MQYRIKINELSSIEEVEGTWTTDDYIELLSKFNFPNAESYDKKELRELLLMAITDYDPSEAAAILLEYRLSEVLSEGQISQLSHDMLLDKIFEEYPEISLHNELFNINQLLYKAYNGKFPHGKATKLTFEITAQHDNDTPITKEIVLKAFSEGLSERSIIKRLFTEQLLGDVEFEEAENIIWNLYKLEGSLYELITSEYWLGEEDFLEWEFETKVVEFEEHA
ncbi:MAG: hypothetical protein R3E32_25450 [Chitinophagales bacterium]